MADNFCGCCGRARVRPLHPDWCVECLPHVLKAHDLPLSDRTYLAQHGVECPVVSGESATITGALTEMAAELAKARELLWSRHGCHALYGDDGEMQCAKCGIDFKRNTIQRIADIFYRQGLEAASKTIDAAKEGR